MKRLWFGLRAVVVTVSAACALLMGAFWMLIAAVMFGNFNLSDHWHLYALLHTFAAPLATLASCVIYHFYPAWKTAALSIGCSMAALGTYFLWTAEGARGLIH